MRVPNRAAVAVTAALAFNAMPAHSEAQETPPAGDQDVAALSVQARQTMAQLGNKVLHLRKVAGHNHHVQDVEVHGVAPGIREVEIDYTAGRPTGHAGLGTYTVTAAFATRSKKLNTKNLVDVSVSQNAGKGGPYALLDLRQTEDGGYKFSGSYAYKKRQYKDEIEAATQPSNGEQKLTASNIAAAGNQMIYLMKVSPTGRPITKQLKPPFAKASAPSNTPDQLPVTAPEPAPAPSEQPPAPTPAPTPEPTPTPQPTLYPETPGQKPWQTGQKGYDVSWANCGQQYPTDAKFVIIGINGGLNFSTNPCIKQQADAFAYTREDFYLNTGWYDQSTHIDPSKCPPGDKECLAYNYGKDAATYGWNAAKAAGLSDARLEVTWVLDVEPEGSASSNTWSTNVLENRKSLEGQHDRLLELGAANVVEYDTTASHNEHFGSDYKQGWPSIGATTWETAENAMTFCTGHEFTGGPSWAMQYAPNLIDKDVAC